MTSQRTLRAYWIETKYELLRLVRMPIYAGPTRLMPIGLYVLIGILVIGPKALEEPKLPAFMFAVFSLFAITSRGRALPRKRAPPWCEIPPRRDDTFQG